MDTKPKLLLCIEDDQDDIALIEEAAFEFDASLHMVAKANGREALMFLNRQKLENHLPCLILLDINLPLMDGREVLDALKKDEVFKRIPVVVFTTSTGQRDQLLCEAYGVEMVTKPNRVYDFKKVLSHLLARCIL